MIEDVSHRFFKGKPSDQELERMAASAVLILRPPPRPGQQPKSATAFMVSEDLAITAAHCVLPLLTADRQEVDVKGFHPGAPNDELTFQTIPGALLEYDDIAALRLVSKTPAHLKLGQLKTVCLSPCDSSRSTQLAGKPFYIFGFPVQRDGRAEGVPPVAGIGIPGHFDPYQPLKQQISQTPKGRHTTLTLDGITGENRSLGGMSGGPIIDKDTGCVIGVQSQEMEGWGRVVGVPLCLLVPHCEPFRKICRSRCRFPWWWIVIAVLVILFLVILLPAGSQLRCRQPIEITQIPPCGAGPDVMAAIGGTTCGADPKTQKVVLFAVTDRWYVQPDIAKPITDIRPDGTWTNGTHLGRQYAALLLDSSIKPPLTTLALPQPGDGVLAVKVVDCK